MTHWLDGFRWREASPPRDASRAELPTFRVDGGRAVVLSDSNRVVIADAHAALEISLTGDPQHTAEMLLDLAMVARSRAYEQRDRPQ